MTTAISCVHGRRDTPLLGEALGQNREGPHHAARRARGAMHPGYSVMLDYWGDADRTRGVIDAARWMQTGDLARIDDEGFCNVVGRIKDVVIRSSENVYPHEAEEFLYRSSRNPGRPGVRRT